MKQNPTVTVVRGVIRVHATVKPLGADRVRLVGPDNRTFATGKRAIVMACAHRGTPYRLTT
ncbi:hypothetical protein ACFLXQ_01545 [Chloroflexota bacterium]